MSMCSLLLYCWKRVFAMTSAFSLQNSISLCPASFWIQFMGLQRVKQLSTHTYTHKAVLLIIAPKMETLRYKSKKIHTGSADENYKSLMKKIKDLNKWRNIPYL